MSDLDIVAKEFRTCLNIVSDDAYDIVNELAVAIATKLDTGAKEFLDTCGVSQVYRPKNLR